MLNRIYLSFASVRKALNMFLNNFYVCPVIVTKIIAKITIWKFNFLTNDF